MYRKIWALVITTSFVLTSFMPALAEDEPVTGGEVVAVIRNADGSTTVVSKAAQIGPDGSADVVLEKGIDPSKTPVEFVATTADGDTITTQAPTKGNTVEADSKTTLANTMVNSMIAQFEKEIGYDLDPKQREILLSEGKKFFDKLPTDGVETVEDLMSVAADYSSLHPHGPMEALEKAGVPVSGENKLIAATLSNKAFRPDEGDWDPMGKPPKMLEDGEEYPSNMAMGLLDEKFLPPYLRGEEGRERMMGRFGDHVGLPGDFEADIPEGAIAFDKPFGMKPGKKMPDGFLPPPLFAFPDDPEAYPEDMSRFQIPGSAIVPEEALLAMKERGGDRLPKMPPNMPFAGNFRDFGFPENTEYDPSKMNFMPPPGAAEGRGGEIFVPKGFDPREFIADFDSSKINTSPSKFEHLFHHGPDGAPGEDLFPPPSADFDFGNMAGIPRDFKFDEFGFQPPEGFMPLGHVRHDDFGTMYGEDFEPDIDDFFGGFDPRKEGPHVPLNDGFFDHLAGNDQFADFGGNHDDIKSFFDGLSPEEQDAFKSGFVEGAFEHEPPPEGGKYPPPEGDFHDGTQPPPEGDFHDGTQPPPEDGFIDDGNKDGTQPPPEDGFIDDGNKDGTQPPPDGGTTEPAPAPDSGSTEPAPEPVHNDPAPAPEPAPAPAPAPAPEGDAPPPQRISSIKARALSVGKINSDRSLLLVTSSADEVLEDAAGVKTTLVAATGTKAKKITATKGVYQIGKAKASKKQAVISFLVDPSISNDSVKVNIAETDGSVDNHEITIDDSTAEEVVTQLDGKIIEMSISDDLGLSKAKGYLLPPGSSTLKMQKAINIKGTVAESTSGGNVISFKLPKKKKLDDGVYTVVFENEGTSYYGKVTIGTLESKSFKVTVKAPKKSS